MERFTVISFAKTKDDIKLNWLIKRAPVDKLQKYLMEKMPLKVDEIVCYGEKGQNVILPMIKEDLGMFEKGFVCDFISRMMLELGIVTAYFTEDVREYRPESFGDHGWLLKYLVFPDLVERIREKYNIESKDLNLVMIDSGDRKIQFLLEVLIEDLNRLTIVTDRPQHFDKFVDAVYEDSGLMVELVTDPIEEVIRGNIIVDMRRESQKLYRFFEDSAIVIDMESSMNKLHYLYGRRRDLKVIYDVNVSIYGEKVKKELAAELLCNKFWDVYKFVYKTNEVIQVNDLKMYTNAFQIKLLDFIERRE